MCLRISKDFQAKEGKSWRGPPGVSPRPNLSQGVLEPVSYETALCTPASIHPLSHHLRGRCVHVSQMCAPLTMQPFPPPPRMVLFAASFSCLWFPLRKSREEKAVNLHVPLAGAAAAARAWPLLPKPQSSPRWRRWGSRPACLGLLTWVHFPFLRFVFSAAGMRWAPAPRGRWKTASSKI